MQASGHVVRYLAVAVRRCRLDRPAHVRSRFVVALVGADDEERVRRRDAVGLETLEEGPEGLVVVLRLGDVAGRAAAERRRRADARRHTRDVLVPVNVRDIRVRHRNARLLHVGDIGQALGRVDRAEPGEARVVRQERSVELVAVLVDEVARGVGDLEAVVRHVGGSGSDLRRDVAVAEERVEAVVSARLVGQGIGDGRRRRAVLAELHALRRRADAAARRAVHRHADVVRGFRVLEGVGVGGELLRLRRVGAEDLRDVDRRVLELDVRRADRADVAPGSRERHPRGGRRRVRLRSRARRRRRRRRVDHRRIGVVARARRARRVEDRVGPVGERASRIRSPVRVERPEAVRDRHPLAVAVKTGQRCQDVVRRMRDQRRVVVREHRSVALDEVEQVRHHLQVRRDVRVVPEEMHVVERELDHVLDPVAELARGGRSTGFRPAVTGCRRARTHGHDGREQCSARDDRADLRDLSPASTVSPAPVERVHRLHSILPFRRSGNEMLAAWRFFQTASAPGVANEPSA